MRWLKGLMVVVVAIGLLGFVAQSEAKSIMVADPSVSGSGPWTFTYSVNLFDSDLMAGDFFVIYDFRGYVGGSIFASAGWTPTVPNTGPVPYQQTPTDNAAVTNLVFTYTGANLTTGPLGVLPLGSFGAQSSWGSGTILSHYAGEDTKLGTAGSTPIDQGNIGSIGTAIPLPAAGWAGLALLGLLGLRRRSA